MNAIAPITFLLVVFVGPFIAAHYAGKGKHRRGWLYALLGGWVGVIVLALREPGLSPSLKLKEIRIREMEADLLLDRRLRALEEQR